MHVHVYAHICIWCYNNKLYAHIVINLYYLYVARIVILCNYSEQ